jgi:hypothetical protein
MKWGILVFSAALLMGCQSSPSTNANSSDPAKGPNLTVNASATHPVSSPNAVLLGNWKGRVELPKKGKDDPMAEFAEAFAGMLASSITLEFKDSNTFELSMMGMPIGGKFEFDGVDLTLNSTTFMGMTKEQLKKDIGKSSASGLKDFEKPLHGTLSRDGKTIRLEPTNEKDGSLVFERAAPETPKKVAKETVRGLEKDLVGVYRGDVNSIDATKLSASEKNQLPMIKGFMENAVVILSADNTYVMKFMFEFEGTWFATGGKLALTPTKMMGSMPKTGATTQSEIMEFWVRDQGQTLEMMPRSTGQPTFGFKRDH